jgi:galactonate dehydratase
VPNFLIQDQSLGIHYNKSAGLLEYLVDVTPFRFIDGYAALTAAPGLGVEINEAAVRRAAEVGHEWRNLVWRYAGGSFTKW